jgi:hypothetical protein
MTTFTTRGGSVAIQTSHIKQFINTIFGTYNLKNNNYLSLETKHANVLLPEDKYSIQN